VCILILKERRAVTNEGKDDEKIVGAEKKKGMDGGYCVATRKEKVTIVH
jgi:hypothetical protein